MQPPAQEVLRFFSDATCLGRFAFVEMPGPGGNRYHTVTTNGRKPLDALPESNGGYRRHRSVLLDDPKR